MIENQWYAVLSSREVKKGKILGVRRFGMDLVFFRTENGTVTCADSRCPHRRASLAKGTMENDHVRCPFHGMEYDHSGACVCVPSDGRSVRRDYAGLHLKTFPVREKGNVLFVWYGEKQPDREPDVFPVMLDESYSFDDITDTWAVHYSRVIENQLDVSHLAFVHHNTIGRGNKTVCNGPKVVWLDDTLMRTSADNEKDIGQTPKSSAESSIKNTNLTFRYPNLWLNHVSDQLMILAWFAPVDEEHTVIGLRFYDRFTGMKPLNQLIARFGSIANFIVERQDRRIVETQIPKKTGRSIGEALVPADLPIMEYREKRYQLQKRTMEKKGALNMNELKKPEPNPKAMYRLSYGLFVCTVHTGEKFSGCIINTAIQAASEPNVISIAVNKANYTCEILMKTKECNISVLSTEASFPLFQRFGFQSGRDTDKFADFSETSYGIAENGIPYITEGANAYFSLKVKQEVDLGSHMLFLCEPVFMTVLSEAESCTYAYYQNNIKPKPQPVGKTPEGKTVWRCMICGYEWEGEELPDDFICPICKHPKADFEKIVK